MAEPQVIQVQPVHVVHPVHHHPHVHKPVIKPVAVAPAPVVVDVSEESLSEVSVEELDDGVVKAKQIN